MDVLVLNHTIRILGLICTSTFHKEIVLNVVVWLLRMNNIVYAWLSNYSIRN